MRILKIINCLACAAALLCASPILSLAQWIHPEDQFSEVIDCGQWRENADGSWDTGPNARLPGMLLSNSKGLRLSNVYVDGVDVAALLERKCGHNRSNPQ
jgi:hypothetical protein